MKVINLNKKIEVASLHKLKKLNFKKQEKILRIGYQRINKKKIELIQALPKFKEKMIN